MRVVVADDAAVFRAALTAAFARLGHEVIAEAADAEAALARGLALRPDVVAVDGRLPPDGALGVVTALSAAGLASLVVASLDETPLVRAALAAGASGAILRPLALSQLREALAVFARTT